MQHPIFCVTFVPWFSFLLWEYERVFSALNEYSLQHLTTMKIKINFSALNVNDFKLTLTRFILRQNGKQWPCNFSHWAFVVPTQKSPFYLWQIRSKQWKNGAGKRKMAKRYRHLFGNSLNFYHLRKPICELLKATFRHKIFPSVVCYHIYEMNIYSTKRNK